VIVGLAEDDVPIARIMRRTSHGRRAVRRNGTGFWRHMTCKGCRGRLSTGDLLAFLASAMRRRIVIGAEDTVPEPGQDTEVLVGIAMVVKRVKSFEMTQERTLAFRMMDCFMNSRKNHIAGEEARKHSECEARAHQTVDRKKDRQ
jgi:hypothetical protein